MLEEHPDWPARQRLQDKLGQRLREREEERRKADELAAAKAVEDGAKKKETKETKEKKKEEEGQEAPYNWLTPDRPPLAAFTDSNIVRL